MADPLRPRASTSRIDARLEVRETRQGRRPGDAYVRIVRPYDELFERGDSGELVATERTVLERPGWTRALRALRTLLIGRPISSEQEAHERLTKLKALAIFSSDNISSSAYATEEMMRILVIAGLGAISLTMPLTIVICTVLAIVATSYWQTIRAYPQGASSYLVTSDNLGSTAGLVAGGALLIDYTLTVAVSVSAAVAAITSVVPELFAERVLIGIAIIALLMLGNLRGIRESGTIFMAPTYLYIVAILGMVAIGIFRTATGTLPAYAPPASWLTAEGGGEALGILLVLRAFSSGAAALTGVEAISDGVPAFKPPEWRNARITLVWAAAIFAALFLGISFMASSLGILPDPSEEQTVLSQMARLLVGDGAFYVLIQVATVLVLALAANTAFADFPRLSSFLARDGFMPRQFAFRGERLAFTTGIVALSGLAGLLLVAFGASVTALIPLYTLGVFLAFTLSQASMVVRWWGRREQGWRRGLAINGLGAATTGAIALIVVESKFLAGAWMVVLALPIIVLVMLAIRGHYRSVAAGLQLTRIPAGEGTAPQPIVIVPVARLDEPARQAIAFANSISAAATAVHVTNDADGADALRRAWPEWSGGAELVVIESPYRALIGPLLAYLDVLQRHDPTRPVLVVLSEFVPRHWWEHLLHNQTALRLKLRLFSRPNTIVADVPYRLRH
ncbi:MAG TPA: APC family permease [Candidatus Limnocylindria bacterium]